MVPITYGAVSRGGGYLTTLSVRRPVRTTSISLWLVQGIVAAVILIPQIALASHGFCEEASPGNFSIVARGHNNAVGIRGVGGRLVVRVVTLQTNSMHVESFYIIKDAQNYLEYGWQQERSPLGQSSPKRIFHARQYLGNPQHVQDIESGDHLLGEHYLSMEEATINGKARYRFKKDGSFYPSNVNRAPPFRSGVAYAAVEWKNQCDSGDTRVWSMDHAKPSGGSLAWFDWTGTHYACDTLMHFGFTLENPDAFRADARTDNFVQSACQMN